MTLLWLDADGMSRYHHMVRHEIYLLYINSHCLKQLNSEHFFFNGQHYVALRISFWISRIKNGPIVCPWLAFTVNKMFFEENVSKLESSCQEMKSRHLLPSKACFMYMEVILCIFQRERACSLSILEEQIQTEGGTFSCWLLDNFWILGKVICLVPDLPETFYLAVLDYSYLTTFLKKSIHWCACVAQGRTSTFCRI